MRLLDVTCAPHARGVRLNGTIEKEGGKGRVEVYFDYDGPEPFVGKGADAFAAAMLLPSMRVGEALEIEPPISPQLRFNLPRIRDVFCTWWPDLRRIEIRSRAGSVGCCAKPPAAYPTCPALANRTAVVEARRRRRDGRSPTRWPNAANPTAGATRGRPRSTARG